MLSILALLEKITGVADREAIPSPTPTSLLFNNNNSGTGGGFLVKDRTLLEPLLSHTQLG